MNSLEEEEGGEAVCSSRFCLFASRVSVGGGMAGEGALPVAVPLLRSALGHRAGARDPQARWPSCQVRLLVIPRAPPALAWEAAFLMKFMIRCLKVE